MSTPSSMLKTGTKPPSLIKRSSDEELRKLILVYTRITKGESASVRENLNLAIVEIQTELTKRNKTKIYLIGGGLLVALFFFSRR